MTIIVANAQGITPCDHREAGIVYVGRPTKWGNPYKIGRDGTREEVIAKYRVWLAEHPHLVDELRELNPRMLVCWCAPKACHADVLAELLEDIPLDPPSKGDDS